MCLTVTLSLVGQDSSSDQSVLLKEDFQDLGQWRNFQFQNIEEQSEYEAEMLDSLTVLKATSDSSASGLLFNHKFNVYAYPVLRWMWRVENIYKKGNAREKSGDDYPIRIYVNFQYVPSKASLMKKAKYQAAKIIYGEFPPHSGLSYIWANRDHQDRIITNPFQSRAKMLILERGTEHVGEWRTAQVNILHDYKEAFGEMPPDTVSLGIMNDSDNTGEQSVSYIDFIEIRTSELE